MKWIVKVSNNDFFAQRPRFLFPFTIDFPFQDVASSSSCTSKDEKIEKEEIGRRE